MPPQPQRRPRPPDGDLGHNLAWYALCAGDTVEARYRLDESLLVPVAVCLAPRSRVDI
jgi:hypothetical protein